MKISLKQISCVNTLIHLNRNVVTSALAFTESSRFPFLMWRSSGESRAEEGQMTQIWRHSVAGFGSWKCQHTFLGEDKMQRRKSQKEETSLTATAHSESSVLKMTSCGLKVANISAVLKRTLKNQSLEMSLHRGREGGWEHKVLFDAKQIFESLHQCCTQAFKAGSLPSGLNLQQKEIFRLNLLISRHPWNVALDPLGGLGPEVWNHCII